MKRPVKLLIAAGVLVVALTGYFIAAHMNSKNNEETPDPETITLAELNTKAITEITYTYQDNTVTLAKGKEDKWYYIADTEFPLSKDRVGAMLAALSSITATRLVSEKPEDFGEFGLADPQCVITVKCADGSSSVFNIGSHNEMLKSYYINVGGTNKAYLTGVALAESFFYDLLGLIEIDSFAPIPAAAITSLQIDGSKESLLLKYFADGTSSFYTASQQWFLSENGTLIAADSSMVSGLLTSVSTLSYSGCAAYKVSDADLGKYGLDKPAYVLTVKYTEKTKEDKEPEEQTFVLRIGNKLEEEDGGYYVMRDGSDMVCTMTTTTLSKIINATRTDLISDDIFAMDLDTVKSAVIKTKAGSVTVSLEEEKEHKSFTTFFKGLASLVTEGKDKNAPTGNPVLQVDFTRNTETFSSMTFALYEHDSNFYRVSFNGRSDLLIGKRAAENLIALAEAAN